MCAWGRLFILTMLHCGTGVALWRLVSHLSMSFIIVIRGARGLI